MCCAANAVQRGGSADWPIHHQLIVSLLLAPQTLFLFGNHPSSSWAWHTSQKTPALCVCVCLWCALKQLCTSLIKVVWLFSGHFHTTQRTSSSVFSLWRLNTEFLLTEAADKKHFIEHSVYFTSWSCWTHRRFHVHKRVGSWLHFRFYWSSQNFYMQKNVKLHLRQFHISCTVSVYVSVSFSLLLIKVSLLTGAWGGNWLDFKLIISSQRSRAGTQMLHFVFSPGDRPDLFI